MMMFVPVSPRIGWTTATGMPTAMSALAAKGSSEENENFGRKVSTVHETTLNVTEGAQTAMSRSLVNSPVTVAHTLVVNATMPLELLDILVLTIHA